MFSLIIIHPSEFSIKAMYVKGIEDYTHLLAFALQSSEPCTGALAGSVACN